MKRPLLIVILLAIWQGNNYLIRQDGDPLHALQEGLVSFGYEPDAAQLVAGGFGLDLVGMRAHASFRSENFPGSEIHVEAVRSVAFLNWQIRRLSLEPAAR